MAIPPTSRAPEKVRGTVTEDPFLGPRRRTGRAQRFGQQHGEGFEFLNLFGGVEAGRAVLHGNDADSVAGTADRDRQEGSERLLAGLGTVGKTGVVLGVSQIHHPRAGGAQPDNALPDAQPGLPDGRLVEPVRRDQFQNVAGPLDVDRGDIGSHFADHQIYQFRQMR